MPSLITPELLTAIGGLLGTGGVIALVRVWREPSPKPGSPDAAAVALAENTRATLAMVEAMRAQNTHFADNNDMFKAMGPMVGGMAKDMEAVRRHTEDLSAIRDALNRR